MVPLPHTHVYYSGFAQENSSHSASCGYKGFNTALGAYMIVGRAEGAELRAAAAKVEVDAGGLNLKRGVPEGLLGSLGDSHICEASGCHHLWRIIGSLFLLPPKFPPNSFQANSNLEWGEFWEM